MRIIKFISIIILVIIMVLGFACNSFATNEIEDTLCSYKNDNYFYVFTGWSLDKENILNNDSIVEYNEVINLYAIYEEYPMIKQATFSVENEDEKILVNGIEVENNYLVNLTYEDTLPTDFTIEAIKEVTLDEAKARLIQILQQSTSKG